MKKTKFVKVEKIDEVIDDIVCNKCGGSCKSADEYDTNFYGLIETYIEGGYNSISLEDGMSYTFSLCEKCLKELFENFKIPVEKKEYTI